MGEQKTSREKIVKGMDNSRVDLIKGNIAVSILLFCIPLLIGNLFQQLYNTVDSYVVGNYVNTGALAAVGASASIINMLVGFLWDCQQVQVWLSPSTLAGNV